MSGTGEHFALSLHYNERTAPLSLRCLLRCLPSPSFSFSFPGRGSSSSRSQQPASSFGANPPALAASYSVRHRASSQDHSPTASGTGTPVKISRKDLRVMSEEEVSLRRSNMSHSVSSPPPKGQLEGGREGVNE